MFKFFKSFKTLLLFNVVILIVGIVIILIIDSHSGFLIKNISLLGETNSAEVYQQEINITFNKPIGKNFTTEKIKIAPDVKYKVDLLGNNVKVVFLENLNYSTEYIIDLSKVEDIFGNNLEKNTIFKFLTKEMFLSFVRYNAEIQEDSVVLLNLNTQKEEEIFRGKEIKLLSANNKFIVFTYKEDKNSRLNENIKIFNIATKNLETVKLNNFRVRKLTIDPNNSKILLIAQKIELQNINGKEIVVPSKDSPLQNLYELDIQTKKLKLLNIFESEASILDVWFMPSGNSILIKANAIFNPGYYYIYNLSTKNLQPLNAFLSLNSINSAQNKIVGINYNNLETYSSDTHIEIIDTNLDVTTTYLDSSVSDPIFKNKNDSIIFSKNYKNIETIRGPFEIIELQTNGDLIPILLLENYSLENPIISYDDSILVIEKFSIDSILNLFSTSEQTRENRDFIYHIKPGIADLIIFDMKEKNIIKELKNSFSAVFIR